MLSSVISKSSLLVATRPVIQMAKASTFPSYQTLALTSPKPFVVHVALNRPEKLNAINRVMWGEIGECFRSLTMNPDCRVIVLSGSGPKAFSAGIDLKDVMEFGANDMGKHEDVARKCGEVWNMLRMCQDSLLAMEKCPKPVIGAVHGPCIGGGLEVICATDIRYCSTDAWFQIKEVDIGMAADVGTLQRMPKLIGSASLVNDLALTGRKYPAQEALDTGFVSKIFADKESVMNAALEIAESIANKSPVAVQGTKSNIIFSRDHTVEEGLLNIALYNMTMLQSEDFMNAAAAQAFKMDPPTFSKL